VSAGPTIDVVVPTYRRSELLRSCLRALREQTYPPATVVIVVRASDRESHAVVEEEAWGSLRLVEVDEPGVVAALSIGIAATRSELVAFTDDDAAPAPDWLERIVAVLAGTGVGGAGGRDLIDGQSGPLTQDIGRQTRWGKLVGNHHLGAGPPRDVDVLKGVNMAFRADSLALPAPGLLRGEGTQPAYEVLVCGFAKALGRRLVYDPAIRVDHAVGMRHGPDKRDQPRLEAVLDAAHNFLVATTALDRSRLPRQALYALALGSRGSPGLGRALLGLARGEREVLRRLGPSLRGTLLALRRFRRDLPSPTMITCAELRAKTTAERVG
jgi:glycosyltransferase involved in cell wall biosynthesis